MALTSAEVQRIKFELGYNVLSVGAEPYISYVSLFDQVIKPYTLAGVATTSSTPVTAATSPTPQTLTLASATGFAIGDVIVVDVDTRQERATIQNLAGSAATVLLSLAHSGTYPVVQEGGESLIRDILRKLAVVSQGMNGSSSSLVSTMSRLGLKRVEDVEFFGGGTSVSSQGADPLRQLMKLRDYWRDELASALGVFRLNGNTGGGSVSLY